VTEVGALWSPDLQLAERGLGVVDTASLLPAADAMQAGSAAAVSVTSTGATGCTALVLLKFTYLTCEYLWLRPDC